MRNRVFLSVLFSLITCQVAYAQSQDSIPAKINVPFFFSVKNVGMEVRKTFHPPEPSEDEISYEQRMYGYKIDIQSLGADTICFQREDSVFFTTQAVYYYYPNEPAYSSSRTVVILDTSRKLLDVSLHYAWSIQFATRGGTGSQGGVILKNLPFALTDDAKQHLSIIGKEAEKYLESVLYSNINNYGSGDAYLKEEVSRIYATDSTEIFISFQNSSVNSGVIDYEVPSKMMAHPNPASSVVTLANLNFVPTKARIIDAISRMVKEPKLESLAPVSYHIGNVPAGIYFLEVSNDAETARFKIQVRGR